MDFNMVNCGGAWALEGRIDALSSDSFQTAIMELIGQTEDNIVLDCQKLEFVSSAGLRVFLIAQKAMGEKKLTLILREVPTAINKIFAMTGFDKFLKIES